MARLTYRGRRRMRASQFVFPKKKRYPIHDRAHARNALARVSANGTPLEQYLVRKAVYRRYPSLKK